MPLLKLVDCLLLVSLILVPVLPRSLPVTNMPVQGTAVSTEIGAKLDALLTRYEGYGLSGTFLVAKDGQIVLHKGYGFADRERNIPNTPATLFEMASITKTFTAAAILRLEMQGKLKTEDLLSRYLGDFPKAKSSATIFHLLAHKSGLIVEGTAVGGDGISRDRFIEEMKETPDESAPGQKYRYTNAGYSVLAAIIEKVSGQSYESFVREQLIKPAGMTNTWFRGELSRDDPRLARGYLGTPEKIEEGPPLQYPWGTRGAGGIISTVADIYKWLLVLQGDKILSAAAKKKAFEPAMTEQFGWHVGTTRNGTPMIDKGGGQVNFATHILYFPSEKLAIVYANNNLQQRWRRTLNDVLPKVALGEEYVLPPAAIKLDAKTLSRFTGSYSQASGNTFEIRAKDGYLYVTENGLSLPASVLYFPQSPTEFTGLDTPNNKIISLRFDVAADGTARDVVVSLSDASVRASKIIK